MVCRAGRERAGLRQCRQRGGVWSIAGHGLRPPPGPMIASRGLSHADEVVPGQRWKGGICWRPAERRSGVSFARQVTGGQRGPRRKDCPCHPRLPGPVPFHRRHHRQGCRRCLRRALHRPRSGSPRLAQPRLKTSCNKWRVSATRARSSPAVIPRRLNHSPPRAAWHPCLKHRVPQFRAAFGCHIRKSHGAPSTARTHGAQRSVQEGTSANSPPDPPTVHRSRSSW